MSNFRRSERINGLLGAFFGCFGMVVVVDRLITVLQQGGGHYGGAGVAAAILILVAVVALAIAMFFGSRWRDVRAENIGAILGLALAIPLVVAVRYGA